MKTRFLFVFVGMLKWGILYNLFYVQLRKKFYINNNVIKCLLNVVRRLFIYKKSLDLLIGLDFSDCTTINVNI